MDPPDMAEPSTEACAADPPMEQAGPTDWTSANQSGQTQIGPLAHPK